MRKTYIKYLATTTFCVAVCAGALIVEILPAEAEDIFLIEPADTTQVTSRDQRISQRKTEFKAQIDEQSLKNLPSRCEKVQNAVKTLKTNDDKTLSSRHDFYTGSANKLNYIIENLKKRNVDHTAVEAASRPFADSVNKYLSDAAEYKAAIEDLALMNCTKDTAGFRSTILSARELRARLASDEKNVKNTFVQIKTAVERAKETLSKASN